MIELPPRWFVSSYSGQGGQCVEITTHLVATRGVVPVRDSKNPTGPVLTLSAAAFTTFVAGVTQDRKAR
ncbi:DUF397 domain-containing protein [Streptomyces sp. NPDC093249]|uniref:DUF397 domain-containing protein n=1 Tax=unclassified Streptomyces TaxID=2593676 RepID=UPI003820CC17